MSIWDPIVNIASKVVGKIPSQNDRNQAAIKMVATTENVDLKQAELTSKTKLFSFRFFVEVVVFIGFAYNYVLPILNVKFHLNLPELDKNVTYTFAFGFLGLSGARLGGILLNK